MTKRKSPTTESVRSSNVSSEAQRLVDEHFDGYVAKLIVTERSAIAELFGLRDEDLDLHLKIVGFHYKSAGVHFYKHGWEAGYAQAQKEVKNG